MKHLSKLVITLMVSALGTVPAQAGILSALSHAGRDCWHIVKHEAQDLGHALKHAGHDAKTVVK